MRNVARGMLLLGALALAACQDTSSPTDQIAAPSLAVKKFPALSGTPTQRAAQIAADAGLCSSSAIAWRWRNRDVFMLVLPSDPAATSIP